MKQTFKAVYFGGTPGISPSNTLTLAFGKKDKGLYETIGHLSSHEIRELLGNYDFSDLQGRAEGEGIPLNTFCLILLRKQLAKKNGQIPLFVDPIHTTFKGGAKDPLQRWFPYLEGYSPKFVELLLKEFSPNASSVYDPFAGVGTTPIAAAEMNLKAFYSEINPLLQFIIKVKLDARRLLGKKKATLLSDLQLYREDLPKRLEHSAPDGGLINSYTAIFGKSQFFDEETFLSVLRSRSFIDDVQCSSPIAAELITIAILSSLIPSSLLQRAGDLRFKTSHELENKKVDFVQSVKSFLLMIIEDLDKTQPFLDEPLLLTEDARSLESLPPQKFDTVITSPPYLNGTNYFRNTKVELWFLRSLQKKGDLGVFRAKSVTAGINDVSSRRTISKAPDSVNKVALALKRDAYDSRIPKMLKLYFQDMREVFSGLRKHLKSGSIIAVDIGDSMYGNTHVPTDKLLAETFVDLNYKLETTVDLRKRLSRNKTVLKQSLLVFSFTKKVSSRTKQANYSWDKKWTEFKKNLPHHSEPFSKRNWGNPLHSLCSYQGKMKPGLAHHLVKAFTSPGDRLLDPFSGVGTIPFEAALNGVQAFGFDINPAASVIAEAKLGISSTQECFSLIEILDEYINSNKPTLEEREQAETFGFNNTLSSYFEHRTLREIILARRFFLESPPKSSSDKLVLACLLHILHGNRPYALSRRSHPITPFSPTGDFKYKPLISHLKEKVERSTQIQYPDSFVQSKQFFQDATLWWPQDVDKLDAIITSPPFFDSTRFHLANWMRLWFSGWDKLDFKSKPLSFVDERQKESFDVYIPVLRQAKERLKNNGVVVFHLGKSRKCDMAKELSTLAKKWFRIADVFSENVQHTESHGISDMGTVVEHQYLVLT